jgi:hypothetical protein
MEQMKFGIALKHLQREFRTENDSRVFIKFIFWSLQNDLGELLNFPITFSIFSRAFSDEECFNDILVWIYFSAVLNGNRFYGNMWNSVEK